MSTQSPSRTSSPRGSSPAPAPPGDTGTRTLGAQIGRVLGVVIALIILALLARFRGIEQDMHFKSNDRVAAMDGDTLRSANAEVRIYGMAPELDHTCTDANGNKEWSCGSEAQAKLKALVARRTVDRAPKGRDRIVAICRTSAVPDFGEALVREGLVVNFGGDKRAPYAAAEADAQGAKHGIWRGTFQKPSDWRRAHPRDGN
jgi:endonuclease YncB( thermonuclease family)